MIKAERDRLHASVMAFEALAAQFAAATRPEVAAGDFDLLAAEARAVEEAFPGLLPPFDPGYFRGQWQEPFKLYDVKRIRHWLSLALARLQAAAQSATTDPVALEPAETPLNFSFVGAPGIRAILERDFAEIERGLANSAWKSVIILCGGMVEALLIEMVGKALAAEAAASGGTAPNVGKMRFIDLIKKAQELKLVGQGVNKLSDTLREYRNLVHVGAETRSELRVDQHEARLAVIILRMVTRDLAELPR